MSQALGAWMLAASIVLVVLAAAVAAGVVLDRMRRARAAWEAEVTARLDRQQRIVRRIILQDVIQTAELCHWTVSEDEHGALLFTPEGGERVVVVDDDAPWPLEVARSLHAAAPDRFPDDWRDFVSEIGADAASAQRDVYRLDDRVDALEAALNRRIDGLAGRIARERLREITVDLLFEGWVATFDDEHGRVTYQHEDGRRMTVAYDEINPAKLRDAMGLPTT